MITQRRLRFVGSFLLACLAGLAVWYAFRQHEPVYQGKRLSAWIDEVAALDRLAVIVHSNSPQVQAVRAIGTNAIPWLVSELGKPPPLRWRLNQILGKLRIVKYRFPIPTTRGEYQHMHQLRARSGFWALAELAEPAIPDLVDMMGRQPEFAPSALAGIGAPALQVLHRCLTNMPTNIAATSPRVNSAESTIGSLYVAVNVGRISRADAAFLLPPVQAWAIQTNQPSSAFWAKAFLREFENKKVEP